MIVPAVNLNRKCVRTRPSRLRRPAWLSVVPVSVRTGAKRRKPRRRIPRRPTTAACRARGIRSILDWHSPNPPVGASLLAMAAAHSVFMCLIDRYREQACSYRFLCLQVCLRGVGRYFSQATAACVVAYSYARIRRLVRLGAGFYRLPVAEKTAAIGFGSPSHMAYSVT
ncbi:hypothetical protein D3C80_1656570 [compost metagenome]